MNRSYSKIRHIQKSNILLEQRLLLEQQNDDSYMEFTPGQTYQFFPVTSEEGDTLKYNPETLNKDIFDMKVLSHQDKVLKGLVGENEAVYDEKYTTPKNLPIQRYFCKQNNPNECITDTDIGLTKTGKREFSKGMDKVLDPEKNNSVFLEITDNNFDSLVSKSSVPFLVDFSAVWCGPCRMAAKILAKIKREYGDKFQIGKVDIDVEKRTKDKYNISSIPVLIIFQNGKVVQKIEGLKSEEEYKTIIDSLL